MAVLTILTTGAARRQAVDPAPPATMTKRLCRARSRLPGAPGIESLWVTDCGLSLALILAEPALRAHPERHVSPPGVGVAGDVPVTARRTELTARHRQPLGGIELLLADDRALDADIPVGRAGVLHAQAEPASGADRRGLVRPAASQHRQQPARPVAVPDGDRQRPARGANCRTQHADMHAGQELLALGSAHGNPHDGFLPDRRRVPCLSPAETITERGQPVSCRRACNRRSGWPTGVDGVAWIGRRSG